MREVLTPDGVVPCIKQTFRIIKPTNATKRLNATLPLSVTTVPMHHPSASMDVRLIFCLLTFEASILVYGADVAISREA